MLVALFAAFVAVLHAGDVLAEQTGSSVDELLPVVGSDALVAPGYTVRRWTTADGLPVNSINDMLQTRDGYLMIATFDGLVRFDGVRFDVRNTTRDPDLPSNRFQSLRETPDGNLWINSVAGRVLRLGPQRGSGFEISMEAEPGCRMINLWENGRVGWGRSTRIPFSVGETGLCPGNEVWRLPFPAELLESKHLRQMRRDGQGRFWIATEQGLGLFQNGELVWIDTTDTLGSNRVFDLEEDGQGTIWIATRTRIGLIDDSEKIVPLVETTENPLVFAVSEDLVYVTMMSGIQHWRNYRLEREISFLAKDYYNSGEVLSDARGRTWTTGTKAVYLEDRIVFQTTAEEDIIRVIEVDHEGTIWIGTYRQGLFALLPHRVEVFRDEKLREQNLYALHQDRVGNLWMGAFMNSVYRLADPRIEAGRPAGELTRFQGPNIRSIYDDPDGSPDGRLIFGTWNGVAAFQEDHTGGGAVRMRDQDLETSWVNAIHRADDGRLLLGTNYETYASRPGDPVDGEWSFSPPPELEGILAVRCIHASLREPGTLWLGSGESGLVRYRPGSAPRRITTEQGMPSNAVRAVHEDSAGILWIASEGHGLARLDPRTLDSPGGPRITVITERDGLWDNSLHQILADDFGWFWISTNRGIFRVLKSDLDAFAAGEISRVEVVAYTEQDGMANREANGGVQGAGIKARDGTLWFPTQESVVAIDPAAVSRALTPPPVRVEEVLAGGEEVAVSEGGEAGVVLAPHQRTFDIAYTALSYRAPDRVRFRYRLEGYEEIWQEAGGLERRARYTKVPPGRYVFRVEARSSEGVWNREGGALVLRITPYFWETDAFRAAAVVLFLLGLWGALLARDRRQTARRRELERIVRERTGELRAEKETVAEQAEVLSTKNHELEATLSQLREAQEQLVEHKKLASLGKLTAEIAHEIRNPLHFINNFAQLSVELAEDLTDELGVEQGSEARELLDDLAGNVGRIAEQGKRADTIVSGMLTHTRSAGSQMSEVDLNALVRASVALAAGSREPDFKVRIDDCYADDVGAVSANPQDLGQAFINLVENAFDALAEKQRQDDTAEAVLRIRTENRGDRMAVLIRDSGIGIAEEHLNEIFHPFMTTKPAGSGTGLGLSIAHDTVVRRHGGEIKVRSRVGEGAEFLVLIPARREAEVR